MICLLLFCDNISVVPTESSSSGQEVQLRKSKAYEEVIGHVQN